MNHIGSMALVESIQEIMPSMQLDLGKNLPVESDFLSSIYIKKIRGLCHKINEPLDFQKFERSRG